MLDLSSNPLFVSAGITTSITCAISGYALYELLSVGPEETETARVINPQLRRQPISANIVPNVSAPENWSVRPGKRPDFMPIASNTLSPEGAVAHTLIALWKQGKLPQHLAPLMQQAESGIDEFQAKGYLEAARIQATQQDYAKALKYLKQISTEVSVHPQAQAKIAEYTEKQTLQAKAWMQKANALAKLKDFSGARIYLKQVPDNTPVYPVAQNKMNEYAQTQNVQANFWFKEASKLASQGKLSAAITYLQRIPLGTSIYTVAQNKITEYSQKQSLKAATPKPKAAVTTPTPKVATPATPAVAKPPKPATPTVTPTPSPTVATPATPDVTTPNPTVATPATPDVTTPNPTVATPATPDVTTPNPTVATPATPGQTAAVVTPEPSAQTLESNPTGVTSPSESATQPAATIPNPRAATVTTANPQTPTESVNRTPVEVTNSIVQPSSPTYYSNPQTVQTPARVPTSVQPRPQIRPQTLQTPTFIPTRDLKSSSKEEKSQTVTPATSTPSRNLRSGTPKVMTPVNPASSETLQLKKAPSDSDSVWNWESFTDTENDR
ncbi:MAG: hypothetical protein WBC69_15625 [Geitlerinemataceae cyanobacterium]